MKMLVVSDTHNNYESLKKCIDINPNIEILIHLGDGENDICKAKNEYPNLEIIQVKGNCDINSTEALFKTKDIQGKNIFLTHGHIYGVKDDIYHVFMAAREYKADILLFGHTHQKFQDYKDDMYIMNPGSLKENNGTYGIIDITPSGIVTNILSLQ